MLRRILKNIDEQVLDDQLVLSYKLCTDTGYIVEDMPKVMDERDE